MSSKETYELVNLLTGAMKIGNQDLINIYAKELATKLYVPNENYTFEEILEGFGYKENNSRQISIDEYMRGRKNG